MIKFFDQLPSSSYIVFDSGYKYIYDKYNDVYRYIPCNGDVAGLCLQTTEVAEPWFSPAGFQRGTLRNAIKLAYTPNKTQRDRLYSARINPIVSFPGNGVTLFGDKTAQGFASAFDRINVRRLFLTIERVIGTAAKSQLFEQNDESQRALFLNIVEPYMREVQGRRGVTDFLVKCDATNNPPEAVDRGEFYAEIFVKPTRTINYITLTFVATRTGVAFNEVAN
jgi:phage tail sheath protein FI